MNGAQAVAPNRHVDQQGNNLAYFLKYARKRPIAVAGTIATGQSGGVTASNAVLQSDIPTIPAWAVAMVIEVTLPIRLTVPAGATARISPFFPYSSMSMQLQLAGSPPWDQISLVPWYLDDITSRRGFDPSMTGVGPANQNDAGPFVYSDGGFTPGGTIVNGGGSPANTDGTVTFRTRVRLQRKPNLLFGAIPLGDPENRPSLKLQLGALVGPNPENNAFQDTAAAGITSQLTGPGTVNVLFECKSLDVLPPGLQEIPTPIVGLGLAVNYSTKDKTSAGTFLKMPKDAAMLYEKVFHCLINNQQGQRADYFGKWLTGEQQSARYEYDANAGTFNDYYAEVVRAYGRYLPRGVYVDDMVSGFNPDNPGLDPYEAHMTPDTGYAAEFGLPATPAWTDTLRIPAGTAIAGAYAAMYEFGLVNVPY